MTVTYSREIATTNYWTFFRLLFRWKGSVYKLIWFELLLFCIAYALLSIIYRLVMTKEQKYIFESICLYCEKSSNIIPVAFVLGFFVSIIVKRWWDQFMALPWPDNAAIFISSFIYGTTEEATLTRRQIMRYLNLSYTMCMRCISSPVKKRFPTEEHLVIAGLMTTDELKAYYEVDVPYNKFYIPIAWASKTACAARRSGLMKQDPLINMMTREINEFRDKLQLLFWYDWINPPLVYVQVATISVHAYFMTSLFARQFVNFFHNNDQYRVDYYIPFFTMFQFVFYMGWLKVGESLINPFGEDDDDFDINYLIDRNLQISYLIVDELHQNQPELVRDSFWESQQNDLPYTEETKPKKSHSDFFSGSVSNIPMLSKRNPSRRGSTATVWYSSGVSLSSQRDKNDRTYSQEATPISAPIRELSNEDNISQPMSMQDNEEKSPGGSQYSMLV